MTDTLSLPDAAHRLSLTHGQIYALMLRGKFPAERRGARWYVSREAIEKMAAERDTEPQPQPQPA